MARKTPSDAAEKWARNLKASVPDITAGVDRVTEAPGAKAAAKADKMLANLTEAVRSGKWADRVGSVPLEEWKRLMKEKGIGRIAAGVDGARAKTTAFFGELFAYQDSIQGKLRSMPDLTLEDNITRMTTWVRDMSKFRKTK